MLNIATTFCKRLNVKDLVTNVPVYSSFSGKNGSSRTCCVLIMLICLHILVITLFVESNLRWSYCWIKLIIQTLGYQKDSWINKKWTRLESQVSWCKEIWWGGEWQDKQKSHCHKTCTEISIY